MTLHKHHHKTLCKFDDDCKYNCISCCYECKEFVPQIATVNLRLERAQNEKIRLVYYEDCVTGEILNCEAIPEGWDKNKLKERLRVFNSKENKTCNACVSEVENGSLIAYLFREATNIRTYSRDAIASALRALDDAKAEIESLEVNK